MRLILKGVFTTSKDNLQALRLREVLNFCHTSKQTNHQKIFSILLFEEGACTIVSASGIVVIRFVIAIKSMRLCVILLVIYRGQSYLMLTKFFDVCLNCSGFLTASRIEIQTVAMTFISNVGSII